MKIKNDLDALLGNHAAKVAAAKVVQVQKETAEEQFHREFLDARKSIVRPAFEEFKAYLVSKGYRADISEQDSDQVRTSASITLRMDVDGGDPSRKGPNDHFPELRVTEDRSAQHVQFSISTMRPNRGGQSGGDGNCKLPDLNAEMLQAKAVEVLRKALT